MRCRVIGEGGEGPWLFAARHDAGSIRNPLRVSMPHCGTLLLHAQLHAVAVELDLVQTLLPVGGAARQQWMLRQDEVGHRVSGHCRRNVAGDYSVQLWSLEWISRSAAARVAKPKKRSDNLPQNRTVA